MDKKTKKKVIMATGLIGATIGILYLLKKGGAFDLARVKIYKLAHAFDGFKVKLPKIVSVYSYPVSKGHIVTF